MSREHLTSTELKIIEQFGKILNKFQILQMTADYLRYKINEYENVIKETKDIIEIIENDKHKI